MVRRTYFTVDCPRHGPHPGGERADIQSEPYHGKPRPWVRANVGRERCGANAGRSAVVKGGDAGAQDAAAVGGGGRGAVSTATAAETHNHRGRGIRDAGQGRKSKINGKMVVVV